MEALFEAQTAMERSIYFAGGHPSKAYFPLTYFLLAGTGVSILLTLFAMFDKYRIYGFKSFWVARLVPSTHGSWIQLNVTVIWLIGCLMHFGFSIPLIIEYYRWASPHIRLRNQIFWVTWPWTITLACNWTFIWGTSINGILALEDDNYFIRRYPRFINTVCIVIPIAMLAVAWPLDFRLNEKQAEMLDVMYSTRDDLKLLSEGDSTIDVQSIIDRMSLFIDLGIQFKSRFKQFWGTMDAFSFFNLTCFVFMSASNYLAIHKRLAYLAKFVSDRSMQKERRRLKWTKLTILLTTITVVITFSLLVTTVTLWVVNIDSIIVTEGPLSEGIVFGASLVYVGVGNIATIILIVQEYVSIFGSGVGNSRTAQWRTESEGNVTHGHDISIAQIKMETTTTRVVDHEKEGHIHVQFTGPWNSLPESKKPSSPVSPLE